VVEGERATLRFRRLRVDGRAAAYLEADGGGKLVVFLHGWGLSHHAYRDAVRRLASTGVRVLAPAMPGFGGTAALPSDRRDLPAYAEWVGAFLDALNVRVPVLLVGHSFGGAVATLTAHRFPERVGALVLVNAVGGGTWTRDDGDVRLMAERPLWDWGVHLTADVRHPRRLARVLPVVVGEALPNLLLSPSSFVRAARLARRADVTDELNDLRRRGLPVVIVWSPRDQIVTEASIDALRDALGDAPTISVPGGHSWLISDPEHFGQVMTNVVAVAERAHWLEPGRARRWWRRLRARRAAARRADHRSADHRSGDHRSDDRGPDGGAAGRGAT
jgi:pimeloyl-ACP methyl ester carboxylesterase